jgi:hypothetical protein
LVGTPLVLFFALAVPAYALFFGSVFAASAYNWYALPILMAFLLILAGCWVTIGTSADKEWLKPISASLTDYDFFPFPLSLSTASDLPHLLGYYGGINAATGYHWQLATILGIKFGAPSTHLLRFVHLFHVPDDFANRHHYCRVTVRL